MRDDTFEERYKIGKIGEDILYNFFVNRGSEIIERAEGYQPKYDIKYINPKGNIKSVEVKTCTKESKNLAMEFKSMNKPSGYHSTQADFYAIVCLKDKKIYVAPTYQLRMFMEKIEEYRKPVKNTTNDSDTWMYLVTKDSFIECFECYSY